MQRNVYDRGAPFVTACDGWNGTLSMILSLFTLLPWKTHVWKNSRNSDSTKLTATNQ